MKTQAVIGAAFGDEGKGKVVSYLCSKSENPLVIRYCGGQQAGHHVILRNGLDHVCSNFGSGALQGFDTYWSKYCTVDPIAVLNELDILKEKGVDPTLYIDPQCPITTPYESSYNKSLDKQNGHGSCGVGVGQTIQREKDHYHLQFVDLQYPSVLKMKYELIARKYYNDQLFDGKDFIQSCQELIDCRNVKLLEYFPGTHHIDYSNYIFEGSQGLLLDQKIGFFPHVTRANTGTKNIIKSGIVPDEVLLVTRAYQTRHGNGPMTNNDISTNNLPNPYEQNFDTGFQGKFRTSLLDLDLLQYGFRKDKHIHKLIEYLPSRVTLVVTCIDLLKEYSLTSKGKTLCFDNEYQFIERIKRELQVGAVYLSRTPYPEMGLNSRIV